MKAKPYSVRSGSYVPCEASEATHVELNLPGPIPTRVIPVTIPSLGRPQCTRNWTWNGDTEKPTLKPSILTDNGEGNVRCHTWITDGKVQFLADCSHEFAGKTLDLLDVE